MSHPPPFPPELRNSRSKSAAKTIITILLCTVIVGVVAIFLVVHYVTASGITRPLDNMFGDQYLKTTVALVELYKVRYGRYPKSLRDIRFAGDWDQGALSAVRYYAVPDGSRYCVEVVRGWMGKPALEYPPEFWQGTGYSASLCPHSQSHLTSR
jgi:hypothetical protein